MTRELIPLETIEKEAIWVAKMQGYRESGTYAEIGHLAKSEECRDFDLAAKQPAHLKIFFDEFWKYTEEHGFITIPDYYNNVYAKEPAPEQTEMTFADFDRLTKIIPCYDFFPEYIESYTQEMQARKRNEEILAETRKILAKYGIDGDCIDYHMSGREFENNLKKWLADRNVTIAEPAPEKPARRVWTEDEIRTLVATNDKVLYGALLKLYAEQTSDEQANGETRHHNGRGFNGTDSRFLSSVAEYLKKRGFLTDKQKYCVRRKLVKYNKQLTRLANAG